MEVGLHEIHLTCAQRCEQAIVRPFSALCAAATKKTISIFMISKLDSTIQRDSPHRYDPSSEAFERAAAWRSAAVSARSSKSVILFSLTLFLSAALLFLMEPMFAKMTLPVLGGTSAVWATCMLFYQAMLLAGYAFANFVTRKLSYRRQAFLFMAMALVTLMVLPFSFPADRFPPTGRNPIPWLLMILTGAVGLPFFVMSTIAPTMQKWFEGIGHERSSDPYFLYAASNVGSMLGLLSYPILVEPRLRLAEQSRFWEFGYVALVLLMIACAITLWRAPQQNNAATSIASRGETSATPAPLLRERLLWMALAFVPSSLMLGVTTVLTTEIPPIPLLWVLPLAVYLLSFILAFSRKPIISTDGFSESFPIMLLAGILPVLIKASLPLFVYISINLILLFVVAMACHGEIAKRRPPVEHLTGFYLWIALGGVLGGLFNGVVAPLAFNTVLEFPIVLISAAILRRVMMPEKKRDHFRWLDAALPLALGAMTILLIRIPPKFGVGLGMVYHLIAFGPPIMLCLSFSKRPIRFVFGFTVMVLAASSYTGAYQKILTTQRSFYGINRVANDDSGQYRVLFSGQTIHGIQSLSPERTHEPLSYFSHAGPIGQIFNAMSGSPELKEVGIAGLGAGSLACYRAPDAEFTFYEIDPVVEQIARNPRYFTFLRDCAPQARVVLGDARISLRSAPDHRFGMIIIDVFGGDSIPIHLVTRQALQLYLSKLDAHGIIVIHISNRYLHLENVVANLAGDAGMVAYLQQDTTTIGSGRIPSTWTFMARSNSDVGPLATDPRWVALKSDPKSKVWTDDYSSVLTVFNWASP
jgi:spermidine synthase/F0F1-type ATP synthase assembly protein I